MVRHGRTEDRVRHDEALAKLYAAIPRNRKHALFGLAALTVGSSLLDVISIGAVIPFLASLIDSSSGGSDRWLQGVWEVLPEGVSTVSGAAIIFIIAALMAGMARLWLARASERLCYGVAHDLNTASFAWLIRQDYAYHINEHSGDVLARFEKISTVTFSVVASIIEGLAAATVGFAIIVFLALIAPPIVMVAVGVLILCYLLIASLFRARLGRNSEIASRATSDRYRLVQRALGGIRDIIIDRSHRMFEQEFRRTSSDACTAYASNSFLGRTPRIVIETLAIVSIAYLALWFAGSPGGLVDALPLLGALALGAQRLLPLIQTIYRGWANVASSKAELADVASMLGPVADSQDGVASRSIGEGLTIEFDRITFAYPGGGPALSDISLKIDPGETIGIAGPSGAGKSTFLDLMLGLLHPSSGEIRIAGVPLEGARKTLWQSRVAQVPQEPFLAETSLALNIAFGGEIDLALVIDASRRAGIHKFIADLPDGYETLAGERGVRLSGGQRQRIAIARALYRQAATLILDEATGALDQETEKKLLDDILNLNPCVTVILVSHREAVLARCDRIIQFVDGRLVQSDFSKSPQMIEA